MLLSAAPGDGRKIYDLLTSTFQGQVVGVALELGILEGLARGPLAAEDIRARFSLGARGGEALLACLLSLGLLRRRRNKIGLSALAESRLLRAGPHSMRDLFPTVSPLWPGVKEAVLHDRPLDSRRIAAWEAGRALPDAGTSAELLHSWTAGAAEGLARNGGFRGVSRLLDVGGGSAGAAVALARRRPRLQVTILELSGVCPAARRRVSRCGLSHRIRVRAGDMFRDPWPSGHDAILFSNVFHDWGPETCRRLARRSLEALPPGGRIYLHEMLMSDARDGPATAALFSFWMLLATRGRQYSARELRVLLENCGFTRVKAAPTLGYFSVVRAVKPRGAAPE